MDPHVRENNLRIWFTFLLSASSLKEVAGKVNSVAFSLLRIGPGNINLAILI